MTYIDAHAHPQFPVYDEDREEVIARARNAGIKMIVVGTTLETSKDAIAFAEENSDVARATVGVHPSHFSAGRYYDENELRTPANELFDADALKELAGNEKVVGIGECGLDYFRAEDEQSRAMQVKGFLAQIRIAKEVQKPLMIHCRSAFPELISLLMDSRDILPSPPGVIHFMSGTKEEAQKLLDMGFSFTFGGVLTFTHDYDEVVKSIPAERLLSETDAPYVAPVPHRGKRNEPAYVVEVVKRIAELKSMEEERMAKIFMENAHGVFGSMMWK